MPPDTDPLLYTTYCTWGPAEGGVFEGEGGVLGRTLQVRISNKDLKYFVFSLVLPTLYYVTLIMSRSAVSVRTSG